MRNVCRIAAMAVLCGPLLLVGGCLPHTGQVSAEAAIQQAILSTADEDYEALQAVTPDQDSARALYAFLADVLDLPQGTYVSGDDIERIDATRFRVKVSLDESSDVVLIATAQKNPDGGWVVTKMQRDQ